MGNSNRRSLVFGARTFIASQRVAASNHAMAGPLSFLLFAIAISVGSANAQAEEPVNTGKKPAPAGEPVNSGQAPVDGDQPKNRGQDPTKPLTRFDIRLQNDKLPCDERFGGEGNADTIVFRVDAPIPQGHDGSAGTLSFRTDIPVMSIPSSTEGESRQFELGSV